MSGSVCLGRGAPRPKQDPTVLPALNVIVEPVTAGEGHLDRCAQVEHIAHQPATFTTAGLPIISVW